MDKKLIRRTILQKRAFIGSVQHIESSLAICNEIMALPEYFAAKHVMAYYPINNEVDIKPLLYDILKSKSLLLPQITSPGCMHAARILSLDELTRGVFDTMEPSSLCNKVLLSDIDVVIVPIVAFDECGGRLGYGMGYYDRFLAGGSAYNIGAAFEMQKDQRLNCEVHDVRMDVIVTEKNLYLPRLK